MVSKQFTTDIYRADREELAETERGMFVNLNCNIAESRSYENEKSLVNCLNRLIFFMIQPSAGCRPIGSLPPFLCPMTRQNSDAAGEGKIYHHSIKRIVRAEL